MKKIIIIVVIAAILIAGAAWVVLADDHSKIDNLFDDSGASINCWAKQDVIITDNAGTQHLVSSGIPVILTPTAAVLQDIDVSSISYTIYIENKNSKQDVYFRTDGLEVVISVYDPGVSIPHYTRRYDVNVDNIQITPANTDVVIMKKQWLSAYPNQIYNEWHIVGITQGKLVFSVEGNIELSTDDVHFEEYAIPSGVDVILEDRIS